MRQLLLASILLAACSSSDPAIRDASTAGDDAVAEAAIEVGNDSAPEAASDSAADAGSDTGSDAAKDAGPDAGQESGIDAAAADADIPPDIPSTRTVTVHVTNTASTGMWLLSDAQACTALGIERLEGSAWVPMSLDFSSSYAAPDAFCCSGPACDSTLDHTLRSLQPGGDTSLLWDGRAVVFSTATFQCSTWGALHWSALQPAGAGTYRVTIGTKSSAEGCQVNGAEADCFSMAMTMPYPKSFCGGVSEWISGLTFKSQVFEMTDTGDVTVEMTIE